MKEHPFSGNSLPVAGVGEVDVRAISFHHKKEEVVLIPFAETDHQYHFIMAAGMSTQFSRLGPPRQMLLSSAIGSIYFLFTVCSLLIVCSSSLPLPRFIAPPASAQWSKPPAQRPPPSVRPARTADVPCSDGGVFTDLVSLSALHRPALQSRPPSLVRSSPHVTSGASRRLVSHSPPVTVPHLTPRGAGLSP